MLLDWAQPDHFHPEVLMDATQILIIGMIGMGYTRKQIASLIKRSEKTIDHHALEIRNKLGYCDAARLTHYALSRNLIRLNHTAGKGILRT
jgi:DNA-binding NarL/FixJ family response regulator